MKRKVIRWVLALLLVLATAWLGWSMKPYESNPDPAARYQIRMTEIRRDHSYFWVDVHLERSGNLEHDLTIPVHLKTSTGKCIEPADTTLSGKSGVGTTELRFLFWVETRDLEGPLELHINGGRLIVKSNPGIPDPGSRGSKFLHSNRW